MSTSAHTSWMPTGRHTVSIGGSLSRALKARKGPVATPKVSRDFYSFRYNFKPESIDAARPGTLEVKGGATNTVSVERPSTVAGEAHVFTGTEQPAKEWDCVLIYDEETGTYTLEKLDSYMTLNHVSRTAASAARSPNAGPTPPSSSKAIDDLEAQLQLGLLGDADADADGEIDEAYADSLPVLAPAKNAPPTRREEEEESSEEESLMPARAPAPAPARAAAPPAPKPKAAPKKAPAKPRAAPKATATAAAPAPAKAKAKTAKRRAPTSRAEVDEERFDFNFAPHTQPAKRARASPPPPAQPAGLVFPGSSAAGGLLPSQLPAPAPAPPSRPAAAPVADVDDEDEDNEDEWEQVGASADAPRTIVMEEIELGPEDGEGDGDGEEIDVNAFEAMMNEHLEDEPEAEAEAEGDDSDEDFLTAAISPVVETAAGVGADGRPMSLNQYAGGEYDEDDDSDSDDDSDDD